MGWALRVRVLASSIGAGSHQGGQFTSEHVHTVFAGAGAVGVADGFGVDVQAPCHQAAHPFDELAQFVMASCAWSCFLALHSMIRAQLLAATCRRFVAGFADAVRDCAPRVYWVEPGAGESEKHVFLDPAATEVFRHPALAKVEHGVFMVNLRPLLQLASNQ